MLLHFPRSSTKLAPVSIVFRAFLWVHSVSPEKKKKLPNSFSDPLEINKERKQVLYFSKYKPLLVVCVLAIITILCGSWDPERNEVLAAIPCTSHHFHLIPSSAAMLDWLQKPTSSPIPSPLSFAMWLRGSFHVRVGVYPRALWI